MYWQTSMSHVTDLGLTSDGTLSRLQKVETMALAQHHDVAAGSVVPDFTLSSSHDQEHRPPYLRGHKVLLCFYRHGSCPVCARSVGKLMRSYKLLAWAAQLKVSPARRSRPAPRSRPSRPAAQVVTMFQSDIATLRRDLTDPARPITQLEERRDVMESAESLAQQEDRWQHNNGYPFLALVDPDDAAAAAFRVAHRWSPGRTLVPSEFLIDDDSRMVDEMRARRDGDTMSVECVAHFLLHGTRRTAKEEGGGGPAETSVLCNISSGLSKRLHACASHPKKPATQ